MYVLCMVIGIIMVILGYIEINTSQFDVISVWHFAAAEAVVSITALPIALGT